jgi:hypothetical protein
MSSVDRRLTKVVAWSIMAIGFVASPARADASRTFATEIACNKASSLGATVCRQAFAAARAEFESRTRSYPSRFACYRAYGPCMPWPAGSLARFRPQLMSVTIGGPAEARTALPVVASGHLTLALSPRSLTDTVVATAAVDPPLNRSWTREMASPALCRQIEAVALKAHLPPAFLARLLWQESSFRADVVSPAGALGIAQFMPATAQDRGLDDPFDPVRSIETSASLLGDLTRRFGNLGLAAAAYNGGPARVSGWLKGQRSLAAETQAYVQRVTGRPVEDWAAQVGNGGMPGLTAPCRFSAAPAGP